MENELQQYSYQKKIIDDSSDDELNAEASYKFKLSNMHLLTSKPDLNIFSQIMNSTIVPDSQLQIPKQDVVRAKKSEFFQEFCREHKDKVKKQIETVCEALGRSEMARRCKETVESNSPIKINKRNQIVYDYTRKYQ